MKKRRQKKEKKIKFRGLSKICKVLIICSSYDIWYYRTARKP